MAFGDYSAQPETKFSSTFVINKNLNLLSNYKKKAIDAASVVDLLTLADSDANHYFTVNVPASIGGAATNIMVFLTAGTPSTSHANRVEVKEEAAEADTTSNLIAAINGSSNASKVAYGAGSGDSTNGVAGITASAGSTSIKVTVTAVDAGTTGNKIIFTDGPSGFMVEDGSTGASPANLAGGTDIGFVPFFLNTLGPTNLRGRTTAYKVEK